MSAPRKVISAGNKYWFLVFWDANGFLLGADTSAPSQGAVGSGAYPILGIQSASPNVGEPEVVPVVGDDALIGQFLFDSVASRQFEVLVAIHDATIANRLAGTTAETIGEAEFTTEGTDNEIEYDVGMIFQSRSRKQDVGVKGKKAWSGKTVSLATARYLGRQAFEGRAAAAHRFLVVPQLANYDFTGVTYAAPVLPTGATGLWYRSFTADNPITVHVHRGTGALSTFNLDYEPVSAAKTKTFVRRVAATTSSINAALPLPYTTTLSAAPAEGAEIATIYEFDG